MDSFLKFFLIALKLKKRRNEVIMWGKRKKDFKSRDLRERKQSLT